MRAGNSFIKPVLMIAVSMTVGLPVLGNAAVTEDKAQAARIYYERNTLATGRPDVIHSAEALYEQLKYESRRVCGSSNIRLTGSVERSVANDECYEGTLTAAVERVNDPAVTALHEN
jgi:UrcA family protein